MSKEALADFALARGDQQSRNEARTIRTGVSEAQKNAAASAFRWPFELLQNALDAGPRYGADQVAITIRRRQSLITFAHDGNAFTSKDLAALLSGGSNKDFDSDETTGRFGTGFLATHALSDRLKIHGLLRVDSRHERFLLDIDRHGDENQILENTKACNDAIGSAEHVDSIVGLESAMFRYPLERDDIAAGGLAAFHEALPYLYAARPSLGRVEIEWDDRKERWTAGETILDDFEDGIVHHRTVTLDADDTTREFQVYWFSVDSESGSALTLVERDGDSWKVVLRDCKERRIFRDYPLQASSFLPMHFALNGKFDPDKERAGFSVAGNGERTATNRRIADEALSGAVLGVRFAFDRRWQNAHLLAQAEKPTVTFHSDPAELQWWTEALASYARRVSELPIVDTREGWLPATMPGDGAFADFVVPRLANAGQEDETDHERAWRALDGTTSLYPPRANVSVDWTNIAYGWSSLGVKVNLVAVRDIVGYVKEEGGAFSDLAVRIAPVEWLAEFLDILGECREKSGADVADDLANLLPNQNGKLRSPAELKIDDGVAASLKDIGTDIGFDVRDGLLLQDIQQCADAKLFSHVAPLLEKVISGKAGTDDIVEQLIDELDDVLPEDKDCSDAQNSYKLAGAKLMQILWEVGGNDASETAATIPLITRGNKAVRWTPERMMMAPVSAWPQAARPFADAYPEDRVLSDLYQELGTKGLDCVVKALVHWGIAFAEPLISVTLPELKEKRLAALAVEQDVHGVVVSDVDLSNLALLAPEMLNRCANDPACAKSLLGLVLTYVVPVDLKWRDEEEYVGRRGVKDIPVRLRPALWLADLKVRAWVPREAEDDVIEQVPATSTTLRDLLEPEWLDGGGDAIRFLTTCFGFDELDLLFLRMGDDETRKQVRDNVAKVVQAAGEDPEIYEQIVQAINDKAKRSRDVERAQRLGKAVEEAIKATMEGFGLSLEMVDRGFDFEVTAKSEGFFEDLGIQLEIGPYLLEIKATTTGSARMTPLQAQTASEQAARYVLCVVDLRGVSEGELDESWTPDRINPLARLVTNIGDNVRRTWQLVDEAASSDLVRIRNEAALRYEVSPDTWEVGISIGQWVERLRVPL